MVFFPRPGRQSISHRIIRRLLARRTDPPGVTPRFSRSLSMRTSSVVRMLGVLCLIASAARAEDPAATKLEKPETVTREEWGSEPQPLPDSRKHTPQFITLHHGGTD